MSIAAQRSRTRVAVCSLMRQEGRIAERRIEVEEEVRTKSQAELSRRSFVKWGSVAAASAGLFSEGLVYCPERALAATEEKGRWVSNFCGGGCGGRCFNRVYVVDGTVVRQKTDDMHPDSPDFPQQRGCVRGRLRRYHTFAADRLKYPMKRKHWEPGTGGDRSLRGRDEWERISWDQALDYVAAEFKRIKENYGNTAFLVPGLTESRLLNAYGGYICTYGQASQGGFPCVATKMKGDWTLGANEACDRFAIRHSKLIVLWGFNSAWSSQGSITYHFLQAKKAGAKIIMIDPWFSPMAQAIADEWIAVRPGTDCALLAAIAYVMIDKNLQDQAFLDKYTIGFDADHMPEDAPAGAENFKDYILGKYDGTPKTPEWASEICGVAPETITKLAQQIATTKPMAFKSTQAPARTQRGANYAQMFYTVGWMTGNVGVLGSEVTAGSSLGSSPFGGSSLVSAGGSGLPGIPNPISNGPRGGMTSYAGVIGSGKYDPDSAKLWGFAYFDMWNAVLTGEYRDFAKGKKPCDIRCICKIGPDASLNQYESASIGYEAFRSVEFVVSSDFFMTTDCLFSDIVLPATTPWERWGSVSSTTNREIIMFHSQVTEPLFEAKDDSWIEIEIGKRLGIDQSTLYPISPYQAEFNKVLNARVSLPDGSGMESLVSVTQADLDEIGMTGTPHDGRVPIKKFMDDGIYQVERYDGDPFMFIYQKAFRNDPDASPVGTASGKLEIYCKSLSETFHRMGYQEIDPIAKYVPAMEGYEETFADWKTKQKGDYPFQLITIHHMRHMHSTFSNMPALRELFANDLVINPVDAENLGLTNRQDVKITSKYGAVARKISINPRVIPGVVLLGQGNWTDLDENGVDIGANTNTLNGPLPTGESHQAFNSCLVKIEPWAGTPLTDDYLRPLREFN